jgi:hypothetical protein
VPVIIIFDIQVNADGTFSVTGAAVASDGHTGVSPRVGYTLTGTIGTDGSLNGSVNGSTLAGNVDSGASAGGTYAPGYYQASSTSSTGGGGSTYAVVGPDGKAFVAIESNGTADAATGTVDTSGNLTATTANNAALSVSLSGSSLTATVTPSGSTTPVTFTGSQANVVAATSRLINLSIRGNVGTGANAIIAGFVTSGTGSKTVVVRGVGPTLGSFGVTGVLAAPQLSLFDSTGTSIASDTTWGGGAALTQLFSQVGAFALPAASADSALQASIGIGSYTALLTGVGGTSGVALAELYDADLGVPTARLVNVSGRANVGTGADVLIAGFVIAGNTNETVLLRGIGPSLAQFGLTGVLATPQITLYDSGGNWVASNTVWGGSTTLSDAFTQVGAFSLSASSADSVLLETLPPGAYTVELSGTSGSSGIGLIEVYEVP